MHDICRYCFKVGEVYEKRHLQDAASVHRAFAACDSRCNLERVTFFSAFWYGDDFLEYMREHTSPKGFNGICWGPTLNFDIDRTNNLDAAHADTITLCRQIKERYSVPPAAIEVYFSGSKGFHVGLATSLWAPEASAEYHDRAKAMAIAIADAIELDIHIYAKVQPFRAVNSRHPKTGLHKIRLTHSQLNTWTVPQILEIAKKPIGYTWREHTTPHNATLRELWDRPLKMVVPEPREVVSVGEYEGSINRSTMEFIRCGAVNGERQRKLYAAACNLAECGVPEQAAWELLEEAALDSGLPPREVRKSFDDGFAKGVDNA